VADDAHDALKDAHESMEMIDTKSTGVPTQLDDAITLLSKPDSIKELEEVPDR
jgi:hypothetical protein